MIKDTPEQIPPTAKAPLPENRFEEINQSIAEMESVSRQMERRFANEPNAQKNVTKNITGYNFFTLSAAVSLIYTAVILLWSSFVTGDVIAVFRLSPVVLIFIGAEIFYNTFIRKSKIRLNQADCVLAAFLIAFTFMLSLISVSLEDSGAARILAQERLAGEIKAKLSKDIGDFENLKSADINLTLNGRSANSYGSLKSIKPSDTVTARFYFNHVQNSLLDFAADCLFILDIISDYDLPFEEVEFYAVDRFNRLDATVDLSFGNFMTENEIAAITNFYISDLDFDLVDFG